MNGSLPPTYQLDSYSSARRNNMHATLEDELSALDEKLVAVYKAIAKGVAYIADFLRVSGDTPAVAGTTNAFGDAQLQADIRADLFLFDCFKQSRAVETASSEEQPDMRDLGGKGYSVSFDPLDGSSIIGADWTVGSIFAIWPGYDMIGRRVEEMTGAAYSMYGPRTILVIARPSKAGMVVQEFTLSAVGTWICTNPRVTIGDKKYFAPANLRAAADNVTYKQLINTWVDQKMTLRYSGGLCPDIHHMLSKGGGVFCNPTSPAAPAKLRLLYECAALAIIVEAAGGASHDGTASVLRRTIDSNQTRCAFCCGTKALVEQCIPSLQWQAQESDS